MQLFSIKNEIIAINSVQISILSNRMLNIIYLENVAKYQ